MPTIIRETAAVRLEQEGNRFRLAVKVPRAYPKTRAIKQADVSYLRGLGDSSFDMAAVWDYGLGVFASK
jgi:hypothetical protein